VRRDDHEPDVLEREPQQLDVSSLVLRTATVIGPAMRRHPAKNAPSWPG